MEPVGAFAARRERCHAEIRFHRTTSEAVKCTIAVEGDKNDRKLRDAQGRRAILRAMGFNPHRKQRRRPSDILFVVAGLVIGLALVAWAFVGF